MKRRWGEAFEFAAMIAWSLLAIFAVVVGLLGLGYGVGKSTCPVKPPCAVEVPR